ncbi:MAG: PilZ domain-containing protein [Candidatus Omnitrophica bacterium]|nr:PilZ domain-containing protein [Candidatus Omnitrophota bacterium]
MKVLTGLFGLNKKEIGTFANDRRREKRYALSLKLNYSNPVTNFNGDSLTKNICKSGLRFPIDKKVPSGTIMDLMVESLYSNALVPLKAEVIWAEEFIAEDDAGDVICEVGVRLVKKKLY